MLIVSILIFLLVLNLAFVNGLIFKVHPDASLNITQLITKYGYPVEIHQVVTEDDYFITIFRIPHGRNSTKVHKYPVVLVPGTCGCSENFLVAGPENGLGYYLSDMGFDVWLTNIRGNRHGKKHKTLNPDTDRKFWNYGWHEIAIYDTPAVIDYILRVSKASELFYVGHSRGTTSFFAFAAEKPEYNKKIKLSIHMGPSCLLKETRTLVKVLGKHSFLLENIARLFDFHVLFPKPITNILNYLGKTLCAELTIFVDFCYLILYFSEYSYNNLIDPNRLQVILQTSPADCSLKELLHYFQIVHSGKFRQYDYGLDKNMKYYGMKTPPLYNLSKITSPLSLFVSETDNLVPAKGVRQLSKKLPNLESIYTVPREPFHHVDFIFSNVTKDLVNKPIYDLFMKYVNKEKV